MLKSNIMLPRPRKHFQPLFIVHGEWDGKEGFPGGGGGGIFITAF